MFLVLTKTLKNIISEKVDSDFTSYENNVSEQIEENFDNVDYPVKSNQSLLNFTLISKIFIKCSRYQDSVKKKNLTTFYCPAILNILLEKYLPLFPLFSLFVVPNLTRRDLPSSHQFKITGETLKPTLK
jgi:hypothetical protein